MLLPTLAAAAGLGDWAVAVWLCNPHPDFGGRTPRQVLADGEFSAEVVARVFWHDRFWLEQ